MQMEYLCGLELHTALKTNVHNEIRKLNKPSLAVSLAFSKFKFQIKNAVTSL